MAVILMSACIRGCCFTSSTGKMSHSEPLEFTTASSMSAQALLSIPHKDRSIDDEAILCIYFKKMKKNTFMDKIHCIVFLPMCVMMCILLLSVVRMRWQC